MSGRENENTTKSLTLTRVRTATTDSNTAFTDVTSVVSFGEVRDVTPALSTAIAVERCSASGSVSLTIQGLGVVIMQDGGRQLVWGEIVGVERDSWSGER